MEKRMTDHVEEKKKVSDTLFIPLYGKAYVTKKGIILNDPMAEKIIQDNDFTPGRKSKSRFLSYFMAIRAKVFDDYVSEKIASPGDTVVLNLGCGLDGRSLRVDRKNTLWYDIDLYDVAQKRKMYYDEDENYKILPRDVTDEGIFDGIPDDRPAVILMEGLCMYLKREELKKFFARAESHFGEVHILADFYSEKAAKLSKYKNPINEVGVYEVYGLDDPRKVECGKLKFVSSRDMSPYHLSDELPATDRFIFRKLYAGSFARGLYKLYEYEKI